MQDVLEKWPDTPVYVVSEELAEQVTGFHVHRGALASYKRRAGRAADRTARATRTRGSRSSTTSSITRTSAPGFRAAAAMGVELVLVTPTCADPLYRRSIKVSMGTVFQVPWTRLAVLAGRSRNSCRTTGYVAAAFALTDDSITLDDLAARRDERLALIFGTEGHGLKPHVLEKADLTVRIPMAGGVDSLNVASSAAVAFYATRPLGGAMRTTERLVLRPFREEDLEPWAALNADPEVTEFLGEPLSREECDGSRRGQRAVRRRAVRVPRGRASYGRSVPGRGRSQSRAVVPRDSRSAGGWPASTGVRATRPRRRRPGWTTGSATLSLRRVIAVTDTPNVRSIAVMRRLGMSFDHEAVLEEDGVEFEATIYSITAGGDGVSMGACRR